jgi:hypothetical protein
VRHHLPDTIDLFPVGIVDAETGEVLTNARVTFNKSGDGSTSVMLTESDGRFGVDVPAVL